MLKQTTNSLRQLIQQKKLSVLSVFIASAFLLASLSGFKKDPIPMSGHSKNFMGTPDVTGAPFNKYLTCTKCHGGGDFGGYITTELLGEDSLPVTSYIPGKAYTFKISLIPTIGTPGRYGFQTTCAKVKNLKDVNAWGTMPDIAVLKPDKKHTYIEHKDLINKLYTNVISIPWIGPAAGTGDVIFYTAGNLTNHSGDPTGDQIVNNSVIFTESVISRPAPLATKTLVNNYKLSWSAAGAICFHNGSKQQKVQVIYSDLQGRPLSSVITIANEGDNIWAIPQGKLHGFTIVDVITQDGKRTSLKLGLNK